MKSARARCLLVASLALCAAGATSCEVDDDDCEYDDDDFDDDDFDDDFDDDDFDDDDIYGCSYIIIVGQSKGGVVVLLTDRPRPDIQAAHVTIAEVALESREIDPEPLYRWDAGRRVDLVSLRGTADTRIHDVVACRGGIRPAAYSSIRLAVRDPSIVLSSGEAIEPRDIDIAGGGNMVIDFAEPLLLGPSEVAFVVLDFDLERSFPAAPGSAGPRWTLRPIVLVDVLREDVGRAVRAPTDLGGVVAKTERGAFDLELSDGRGVLKVRLAPGASVRGAGPEPLAPGAIRAGSRVLARGAWSADGSLLADSIVLGETFEAIGLVRELAPAEGGCLDARVLVGAGQPHEGDLRLEACPRTIVSLDRVGPLGLGDLREGMMVSILAHAEGRSPPQAAIIDVKGGPTTLSVPEGAAEGAAGAVIAVDEASGIVAIAAGAEILEIPAAGAPILLLEEAGGALRQRTLSIQELEEGMRVEAHGGAADDPRRILIATPGEPGKSGRE
jgi:hypothetical protein